MRTFNYFNMKPKHITVTIQLRNSKKADEKSKRRNFLDEDQNFPLKQLEDQLSRNWSFEEIVNALNSEDQERQLLGMQYVRRLNNQVPNRNWVTIERLSRYDIVPICIRFLQNTSNHVLQCEAALALARITLNYDYRTNSDISRSVRDQGAVPHLIALLQSNCINLVEQAVSVLKNLAAERLLSESAIFDDILPLMNNEVPLSLLRNIVEMMSRISFSLSSDRVKQLIAVLPQVLDRKDNYVMLKACKVLNRVISIDNIEAVIDSGIFKHIRHMLENEDDIVRSKAAKVVLHTTNVGSPEQIVDLIENYNILKPFVDIGLDDCKNPNTNLTVEKGLYHIINAFEVLGKETENPYLMIQEMIGLDNLKNLKLTYDKGFALDNIDAASASAGITSDNQKPHCYVISHLVALLQSNRINLVKQAVSVLKELALKIIVSQSVIFHNILPLINSDVPLSNLRNIFDLMSYISYWMFPFDQVKQLIAVLPQVLDKQDNDIKYKTCIIFNRIMSNDIIKAVIDAGIFQYIPNMLKNEDANLRRAALGLVLNTTDLITLYQIMDLIKKYKILKPLADLWDDKSILLTDVQLSLCNIINAIQILGTEMVIVHSLVDEMGGLKRLTQLKLFSYSDSRYMQVCSFIDTYFGTEDDEAEQ